MLKPYFTIENHFNLDADYGDSKRVSYSLWDVLGDVGGFHDGLFLLFHVVWAPFAAKNFFFKLIS